MCRGDALRIDITRQLVPSYFNLVRRNLTDGVPKAIMLCLVNEVKEQMQARPPRNPLHALPGELRWFCARQGALLDVLYRRDESGNVTIESLLASPEPNTFPFIPLGYRRTYGRCWLVAGGGCGLRAAEEALPGIPQPARSVPTPRDL